MTVLDYILAGSILLAVVLAVSHIRKNKGCCGDCRKCSHSCQSCQKREAQ